MIGTTKRFASCMLLAAVISWLAPAVVRACLPNESGLLPGPVVNVTDELPGGG